MPYHILNSGGVFYAKVDNDKDSLNNLSAIFRACFPSYSTFTSSIAYYFTWTFEINSDNATVQVILGTDMQSSFMLVAFFEMDMPPDQTSFYEDLANVNHLFTPSTTNSNVNYPGLFVFQLNSGKN
jgi:hypothetical protein